MWCIVWLLKLCLQDFTASSIGLNLTLLCHVPGHSSKSEMCLCKLLCYDLSMHGTKGQVYGLICTQFCDRPGHKEQLYECKFALSAPAWSKYLSTNHAPIAAVVWRRTRYHWKTHRFSVPDFRTHFIFSASFFFARSCYDYPCVC